MQYATERRVLQAAILIAGLVPIAAGTAGVCFGIFMIPGVDAPAPDLDNHFRYLSGLLLGIGLVFWSCVPKIERCSGLFRMLATIVFVGGLGRLLGAILAGPPSTAMRLALVMELLVTPLLALWQARIAARAKESMR